MGQKELGPWQYRGMRAVVFVCISLLATAAPIRLHPQNPHYFLYRGQAIALVSSGEHYGSVMNADFDYRRYLDALRAEGLNYTRIFGGSYREVAGKSFGIRRNTLAPAEQRWVAAWAMTGNKFDLQHWNPEFFDRYRDFLSEAAKRGIVVEVTLFSSHYAEMQWAVSALNSVNNINGTNAIDWKKLHTLDNGNLLAHQERYARKLVREANAFDNVIFEIQNEPWSDRPSPVDVINPYLQMPARDLYPNSVEVADELSLAWQARVVEWITSEESGLTNQHLIAQNYCNFRFPMKGLLPGVAIANFHYAYPEAVTLNYGLGKAISSDETGFLGLRDAAYRRQAWNFLLAGGSAFNSLDYSFSVGHEDGSDGEPNGPGGGSRTLRRQLGVLGEFLRNLPLIEMTPDTHIVKHAAGAYARALSSSRGVYAIYLDGAGPIEVTLDLPAGEYLGEWLNPENGASEKVPGFRHQGGAKILKTPGFPSGIALRLGME
jgi:hypothetical protein